MINARELRIGNWAINDCTDEQFQVTAADILTASNDEDWLLKFGFEQDAISLKRTNETVYNIASYKSYQNYQYQYSLNDKTLFVCDGFRITICEGIDYVHQLQNLIFAMKGEELTLKQ